MKTAVVLLAVAVFAAANLRAQNEEFPGVQKAMSPEQFERAGLNKLSPEERAQLDEFIRGYVSTSTKKAADAAVDQAVKEKAKEPDVIESNIVGPFNGYRGSTKFVLANGQVWQQSQRDVRPYNQIDSPPVIIVRTKPWGWRMYVLGGGNVRVSRVK